LDFSPRFLVRDTVVTLVITNILSRRAGRNGHANQWRKTGDPDHSHRASPVLPRQTPSAVPIRRIRQATIRRSFHLYRQNRNMLPNEDFIIGLGKWKRPGNSPAECQHCPIPVPVPLSANFELFVTR